MRYPLSYLALLWWPHPLVRVLLAVDLDLRFVDSAFRRLIEDRAGSQQIRLDLPSWRRAGAHIHARWIDALLVGEIGARVHGALCSCQLTVNFTVRVFAHEYQSCLGLV